MGRRTAAKYRGRFLSGCATELSIGAPAVAELRVGGTRSAGFASSSVQLPAGSVISGLFLAASEVVVAEDAIDF